MNAPHQELIERIRGELQELEGVVQRALRAWPKAQRTFAEQEFYIDSVALNLQSFYAGAERLFELIARRLDQALPVGETWHRDLLVQMAQDVPNVRPAVISQDNVLVLDKFRRFRHLVHNVYAMNLQPDKMNELMTSLPVLWARLRDELLAFASFLDEL